MRNLSIFAAVCAALATAPLAEARETGSISGVVSDDTGVEVPGAAIVLSGVELAGERRVLSREDGSFRFEGIAPGKYELVVLWKDSAIYKAEVAVVLGSNTPVRVSAPLTNIEVIEVVEIRPAVDTTQSSFSTTLSEDAMQRLPWRTYQGVANSLPGVTGRVDTSAGGGGDGNPSVRGEGQYGNNYMIDGVSTRDPTTNTFGQNVNFDAIKELQVYTDGAPAEFGQFTGMFVNVVTKDGADEHFGSLSAFYGQHAWLQATYDIYDPAETREVPTTKARFRRPSLNVTAGGPLVREKLWYFSALDLYNHWSLPEGVAKGGDKVTNGGRFLGKVTAFPTNWLTLRYTFQGNYSQIANYEASQLVSPEADANRRDFTVSHLVQDVPGWPNAFG